MSRFAPFVLLLAGVLAVGSVGCEKDKDSKTKPVSKADAKTATLWSRLGGQPAVEAVVHDFVGRAAGDKSLNFTREGKPNHWEPTEANVKKLETRLVQFISSATGGPLTYKGKDMTASHTGMQITDAEFDKAAGHLIASLDKFKVPKKEKDELVAIVGTTRKAMVGK